jgi:hypothetical protein
MIIEPNFKLLKIKVLAILNFANHPKLHNFEKKQTCSLMQKERYLFFLKLAKKFYDIQKMRTRE